MDQTEILICQVLVPIFCSVLCPSLQQQQQIKKIKGRGEVPTLMILYLMNQVNSACVIQCTIQNFQHFYKSENLEFKNDKMLVIKHTLYICFIFPLPLRMIIILWWIYSTSTLPVGKTGDSYKDSVYKFYASIRIWHCIFSVSFRFPFRSVFRSAF